MSVFELLIGHLEGLEDHRVVGRTSHKLIDILVIGCLTIVCHGENWDDMEYFGKSKEKWLKNFLELPNGIPSHDTFNRVFSLISPNALCEIFINWINSCRKERNEELVCIDGKTLQGTVKQKLGRRRDCVHLVNAWSTASGLFLGQMASNGSGNCEMRTAVELLEMIGVKGGTIICDAGIGKKSFLEEVLGKGANYITPIKKNPKIPYERVESEFNKYKEVRSASGKVETVEEVQTKHGRKERRFCTIIRKENFSKNLFLSEKTGKEYYPSVNAIGKIVYEVEMKETRPYIQESTGNEKEVKYRVPTDEVRRQKFVKYFITSLECDADKIFNSIRKQWAIESQLHWVLDTAFGEDANRTKEKIAAQNLSLIRKLALNLAKQEKQMKASMKAKLKMAGWSEEYLEKLLFTTKID